MHTAFGPQTTVNKKLVRRAYIMHTAFAPQTTVNKKIGQKTRSENYAISYREKSTFYEVDILKVDILQGRHFKVDLLKSRLFTRSTF